MAGSLVHIFWLAPFGLLLGWGVNYLSDVLPTRRSLGLPVCPSCGGVYRWRDYWQALACPACGKPHPVRAWLLPLVGAVVALWFWFFPPYYLGFWWGLSLLTYFALVTVIDIEHHLVLHAVSTAGAIFGLAMGIARHGVEETLLGGGFGFGVMLALYLLGRLFGRLLARRRGQSIEDDEALGFGDVTLGGVIGLVMGWPAIAGGLFLGILLGGVVGGAVLLRTVLMRTRTGNLFIPYAPFLVLATIILLYPAW